MPAREKYDAVVVGSGPNGLAAAVTLARQGYSVLLREGAATIGGGMRSAELTLPGYLHDVCSAIHPLGIASPFFADLPLADYGLRWIHPDVPAAQPLPDGSAVVLHRSIERTAEDLGPDAGRYRALMEPLVHDWPKLAHEFLGPLRFPRYPFAMARFSIFALQSADMLAKLAFRGIRARSLFAGLGAHSILSLFHTPSAAFGLMLGVVAHVVGWPLPRGGSQSVANALGAYFESLGGEIEVNAPVSSLEDLPPSRAVLLDIGPVQFMKLTGDALPSGYRRKLRGYRYGPGVFKIDLALDGPIPWAEAACAGAGTVHLGGTYTEIAQAEHEVWQGRHPEKPFVLLAQQSNFDPTRAPDGKHTVWAYCHVPNGSTEDMTERIECQIERAAPGFRDRIIVRSTKDPAAFERYNPNYIGGDIMGGVGDLRQLFTRPTFRLVPYSTPIRNVYLCSASTPPGGGVHGMCGFYAAKAAMRGSLRGK